MFRRLPAARPAPDHATQARAGKRAYLEWLSAPSLVHRYKPSAVMPALALALIISVTLTACGPSDAAETSSERPIPTSTRATDQPTPGAVEATPDAAADARMGSVTPETQPEQTTTTGVNQPNTPTAEPTIAPTETPVPTPTPDPRVVMMELSTQRQAPSMEAPLVHPYVYAHSHPIIAPILADKVFDQFKAAIGKHAEFFSDGQLGVLILKNLERSQMTFERINEESPDLHVKITATFEQTNQLGEAVAYIVTANAVMEAVPHEDFPRNTNFARDREILIPVFSHLTSEPVLGRQ